MHSLQFAMEVPAWFRAAAVAILVLHIAGGAVGILSGAVAVTARKGGRPHALAGKVFFASMLVMAALGALLAPFLASAQGDPKRFDSIIALFTAYLIATSWATVRRKPGTIGAFEKAACAFAALLAAGAISIGLQAAGSASRLVGGFPAQAYYAIGGILALSAALDLKTILNRGLTGAARISRHLWRMCVALFIANGSFFLGQQDVMPAGVRGSPILSILALAPLALMLFWLVRVRLGKRFRAALRAPAETPAPATS